MKKVSLSLLLCASLLWGLCTPALAAGGSAEEPYTIIFDRNTTADPNDNESYEYETTGYDENWQEVTETHTSVITVEYSDTAYIDSALPSPEREGYYFAGWQTRPVVTQEELSYGANPYEWYFGTRSRFPGDDNVMYIKDMESLNGRTATLYARWVEMKDISTEEELRAMADDLRGAYRLVSDITLTQPWEPVGTYFSNYEQFNETWWTYAFRGIFDGNGHRISGLVVNGAERDVSRYTENAKVWHDDGDTAQGCAAMFGAAATGAEFKNFTLDSPVINVSGEYAVKTGYIYAAPVIAFDMAAPLQNVAVNNPTVKVEATDTYFNAVGGAVAGGWNGGWTNCTVKNAEIDVDVQLETIHGAEVYVGGMIGESYAIISDCDVSAAIRLNVQDVCPDPADKKLAVDVGGFNACNTSAQGSTVDASLDITVSKPVGAAEVSAGGLCGLQRYLTAENNTIKADITTDCTLDPEQGRLDVGQVAGGMDVRYITQILMYSAVASAGCKDNVAEVKWNGETVTDIIKFRPELDGQPVGWINKGEYEIAPGYKVPSNIEALSEKYGSYIPAEYLQDGIIWIIVSGQETQDLQQPEETPSAGPEESAITTYIVVKGDSLWKIADKTLGSGERWEDIYEANKSVIKNPHIIFVGQVLIIPEE